MRESDFLSRAHARERDEDVVEDVDEDVVEDVVEVANLVLALSLRLVRRAELVAPGLGVGLDRLAHREPVAEDELAAGLRPPLTSDIGKRTASGATCWGNDDLECERLERRPHG